MRNHKSQRRPNEVKCTYFLCGNKSPSILFPPFMIKKWISLKFRRSLPKSAILNFFAILNVFFVTSCAVGGLHESKVMTSKWRTWVLERETSQFYAPLIFGVNQAQVFTSCAGISHNKNSLHSILSHSFSWAIAVKFYRGIKTQKVQGLPHHCQVKKKTPCSQALMQIQNSARPKFTDVDLTD